MRRPHLPPFAPPRGLPAPYPTMPARGASGRPRLVPFPVAAPPQPARPAPLRHPAWCLTHNARVDRSDPAHTFCDLMFEDGEGARRGVRSVAIDQLSHAPQHRLLSGVDALDKFLGDDRLAGWVWNSVVMVAGPPGSGKSTLLTQLAHGFAAGGEEVLYCTGEEAPDQVAWRAVRLGATHPNLRVLVTRLWSEVLDECAAINPGVVIVDSAQVMSVYGAYGPAASSAQVNALGSELKVLAKDTGRLVIVVGQINKEGDAAGTMQFQHIVDVMLLYDVLENGLRRLRSLKNRFGATSANLMLRMTALGLEECEDGWVDPNLAHAAREPGVVVFPAHLGDRVVLTRVEALVTEVPEGETRSVTARGVSVADVKRIVSALMKANAFSATSLGKRNVSVEVRDVAGEPVKDIALDLALATAILSSALEAPAPAAFGRVTLTGAVEMVPHANERAAAVLRAGLAAPAGPPKVRGAREIATLRDLTDCFDLRRLADVSVTPSPREAPPPPPQGRGACDENSAEGLAPTPGDGHAWEDEQPRGTDG